MSSGKSKGERGERRSWAPKHSWRAFPGHIQLLMVRAQSRSQDFISTEANGWTGGLGAEPPAGSRSRAPGQGWSPSEAESFSV